MPLKKYSLVILLIMILTGGAVWANRSMNPVAHQPQETDGPGSRSTAAITATLAPTIPPQVTLAVTPGTATPEPTATIKPTATVKPTVTPKPTATPTTAPPTPTAGPIATPTAKPTLSPKPTVTAKPTTTPQPTVTPTTAPGDLTEAQWIAEVFRLTNLERQKKGLPAFQQPSAALLKAAAIRAKECATSFSHTRPDGTEWHTVLEGISCRTAGENIGCGTTGYLTPQMVVDLWMNSDGHRANILKADFTTLAVGFYRSAAKKDDFLAQIFIG